jgi:ABC-2 type transport system permease protein
MNAALAGFGDVLKLQLRRSWLRMSVWALVFPILLITVASYMRTNFTTQAGREAYVATTSSPALSAMTGLFPGVHSTGGLVDIKLWTSAAVTLAVVTSFLVTRMGRAEEESGRAELLRQGAVGRHTSTAAGLTLTTAFLVVTGLLSALACVVVGLSGRGALTTGASYVGVGFAFMGVAAVTGQLASTGRTATGIAAVVLALAYLLRAVADANATGEQAPGYIWASPLGWGEQMRPFEDSRLWPVLPCLVLGLLGCGLAVALENKRDLGAGVIPSLPGARHASRLTRSVAGLPLRLQRVSVISWLVGIAVTGAFFGGVARLMNSMLADTGGSMPLATALTSGADSPLQGLLGYFLVFLAVLVTAFAVQSALSLRHDEAATGEMEWATGVSRPGWVVARLGLATLASGIMLALGGGLEGLVYGAQVDDPGQGGSYALAALGFLPVVALVIAVVGCAAAWLPRAATAIGWTVFAVIAALAALGDVLGLPHAFVEDTPYWAVPLPGEGGEHWGSVVITAVVAVALMALALLRYRRRDLVTTT